MIVIIIILLLLVNNDYDNNNNFYSIIFILLLMLSPFLFVVRMTQTPVFLLVNVTAKRTPWGASAIRAKTVSTISVQVIQLVAFHVAAYWMAPRTGTVHVTQVQDSVTAKTG